MVAHSDEKYQCEEMSDCPYTGTTLINKKPWEDWPAGQGDEESADTNNKKDSEIEMMEENDETRARQQEKSTTARKPGLINKLKRLFRK